MRGNGKITDVLFKLLGGASDESVWLIVGLGNPGGKYEFTRHNVGFRAVDAIAETTGIPVKKNKLKSLVGEGRYDNKKLVLIKPQTFMNLSGEAVRQALGYYKARPEHMVVIYDDVDIGLGKIRLRAFGGPGSHNGMRSIADNLGEDEKFPRIRIGIGKQPAPMELRDFVLTRFSANEEADAGAAVSGAASAALDIVRFGIERAMNSNNPKKEQ